MFIVMFSQFPSKHSQRIYALPVHCGRAASTYRHEENVGVASLLLNERWHLRTPVTGFKSVANQCPHAQIETFPGTILLPEFPESLPGVAPDD